MNAKKFDERIKNIKKMYSGMEDYDEDKWIKEALIFRRDKSEIPIYDPTRGNPPILRPRYVDISVKNIDSHWFRFQSAAKKQISMVLNMVEAL